MQPTPPPWPDQPPQSPQAPQPPTPRGGATTSRLTITLGIVSVVSLGLIVALIGTLIIVLQRGMSSSSSSGELQTGAASAQTATVSSVQATSTAEGTPASSGNGGTNGTGSDGAHGTPTPKPTATPAGPPSVQVFSNSRTGKSDAPIGVNCPKGELALSGGWSSTARSTPIDYSKRSENGWQVLIDTTSVGLIPTTTVYVVCLRHVAGASVTERQATNTVNGGSNAIVAATCTPDEVLVGGGVQGTTNLAVFDLGPRAPQSGFEAYVAGYKNQTQQSFTSYAECLRATGAKSALGPTSHAYVSPGASAGIQAACPGSLIVGGWIHSGDNSMLLYDYSPSNSSTWQAHVTPAYQATTDFDLTPLCLFFS